MRLCARPSLLASAPTPRVACSQCQTATDRNVVARMERSEIRVRSVGWVERSETHHLSSRHGGFRFALPTLRTNKIREAERRQTRSPRPVRKRRTGRATDKAACAALPLRARSPAGVPPRHLRQRPNATAQLQFTRFLGRNSVGAGVTRSLPSQYSGRCSPQAGRRAGRAFLTRSRPGAGLTTPPAGTALAPTDRRHPDGIPSGQDLIRGIVIILRTNVKNASLCERHSPLRFPLNY